ncbi:hypothetical protein PGTUg99_006215 [Puccinia graminis f. sp. tritici]|uniref:Uncharacterized protein n=1 Tax=Puccinia graminis f. sp. tritici TaxID=56615 RepID=A0A5B0Q3L5_PUCGR|nr:hypothetical protein PGTUg99_006215 [Puccinia graminis f. sp. tritici]
MDVELAANKKPAKELAKELHKLNGKIVEQEKIQNLKLKAAEKKQELEEKSQDTRLVSILVNAIELACPSLEETKVPQTQSSDSQLAPKETTKST